MLTDLTIYLTSNFESSEYYLDEDGNLHNENGPAFVSKNFTEYLYHGQRHRLDGPSSIHREGSKFWWKYGKKHRSDGPSAERSNGRYEFWIEGKNITDEVNVWIVKNKIRNPFNWDKETKILFKLTWF